MTDTTQGADAPDDAALFSEATGSITTLDEFENPKLEEPKPLDKPADKSADKPADKPGERPTEKPTEQEPPIPAGRLREESEARRRAERERDDLAARLAALARPQTQQQSPPKKPDVFEDASGFVKAEVGPMIEQFRQELQVQREAYSMDMAVQRFGPEMVVHSRQALEQGMQRNDPMAWATYNRAMQSHDPYGVIAGWFHERVVLHEVGGDLSAFRKREREEALKDPEFLKAALEHAKGQASANGSFTNQSVKPSVPKMPSLGNIGAAGGDTQQVEASDLELFRAATTAKRR
jgi:hypothetical protein